MTDELCDVPSDGLMLVNIGDPPNTLTLPGMAAGFAFACCCCNFVECFECLFDGAVVLVLFVGGKANILGLSMDG